MKRENLSKHTKGLLILAGAVSLGLAFARLPSEAIHWGFLLILAFSTLIAPRMSLTLPRSRFAISFSDASIFLACLLYGGPAAIIVAGFETLANCLYLRSKGFPFGRLMIPANVSISVVSATGMYLVWLAVPGLPFITPEP